MKIKTQTDGGRRIGVYAAVAASVLLTAACDVTNPGPVQDEFLTLSAAQQGFVNGAKERMTRAVGWMPYGTGLVARELFPGGQTGSYGKNIDHQAGSHVWSSSGPDGVYNNSQQARWIAEEAIRRLTAAAAPPAIVGEAYVWAGYANRLLGENWCEAVLDGGPIEPGSVYFSRAEAHFTAAIGLATSANVKTAAYAGRAQVRTWLKNWAGAAADAALVPDGFVFEAEMDITGANSSQRNHIWFATASTPYRSISVKFTYFEDYYRTTGDPRAAWTKYTIPSDTLCVGSLQGLGRVPCLRQAKFKTENDNIRIASGREMRLIEAEALLSGGAGNIAAAMAKINGIRTVIQAESVTGVTNPSVVAGVPLTPWVAVTLDEAWTILKRERGIETWLEGRRMGDQRRWEGTPGSYELPNFEARSSVFTQYPRGREVEDGNITGPRVLCFNISNEERNTNPNIEDVT